MDIEEKAKKFLNEHPEEVERLSKLVDWLLRDERWLAVILRRDLMKGGDPMKSLWSDPGRIQGSSLADIKRIYQSETLRECGECIL